MAAGANSPASFYGGIFTLLDVQRQFRGLHPCSMKFDPFRINENLLLSEAETPEMIFSTVVERSRNERMLYSGNKVSGLVLQLLCNTCSS
jgi:hypothetical protein